MQGPLYLRKSRADDPSLDTAEVLRNHRAALLALARREGITVTDIFEEVVSGESLYARTEMQRLLEGVRAGQYDCVLCMDIDRLGRGGMADQGVILDAFRYSDTLIVTPEKVYDLSNDVDQETTEMKAFFARWEYRMIRKRMRRGLMQCIQSGGYVANAPYGYRKCTIDKLPSLEIIPEEAAFVRMIFDMYLQGIGTHRIADELTSLGSVPHRGTVWNRNSVRTILRNPTYKGMVAWNRVKHYRPGAHGNPRNHVVYTAEEEWLMVKGKHPAIISPEDWDKAQSIRVSRHIPSSKKGKNIVTNPFAGLVKCANCGRNIQRMGDNNGDPYMLCNTKGCMAGVKFDIFEETFLLLVSARLDRLRVEAAQAPSPSGAREKEKLSVIQAQLRKLDARVPRLYEFLEDGTYDRDTFRSRMEAVEHEKSALLEQQSALEEKIAEISGMDLGKAVEELEEMLRLYPTLTVQEKNNLLKSLFVCMYYRKAKKSKPSDFTLTIIPRHFIW